MIKKLGVVTVGVAAGLMVAAPFASATESHHGDEHGGSSKTCEFTGGTAEAAGEVSGDSTAGNLLTQAPVGGANAANIACNDILNGNLNGNTVDVSVGDGLGLPTLPELPIELPALPA